MDDPVPALKALQGRIRIENLWIGAGMPGVYDKGVDPKGSPNMLVMCTYLFGDLRPALEIRDAALLDNDCHRLVENDTEGFI